MLNADIIKFLNNQRVCVLAVEMLDGSPHAATVHFAYSTDPLLFVMQTNLASRKAETLRSKEECRVSLVIGIDETLGGKDITFQVDGIARLVASDGELAQVYLNKFKEKKGKWPDDVFLSVDPNWWRYTKWEGTGKRPQIIKMN